MQLAEKQLTCDLFCVLFSYKCDLFIDIYTIIGLN